MKRISITQNYTGVIIVSAIGKYKLNTTDTKYV